MQMGLQLGQEYQKRYDRVVRNTIIGSLTDKKKNEDVEQWISQARTSVFRQGLLQIGQGEQAGVPIASSFPMDMETMD